MPLRVSASLRSFLVVVLLAVTSSATASAAELATAPLQPDPDAVLHNPDMGWVLYENYPVDPRPGGSSTMVTLPDESFPDAGHVAIMFAWSDVEREADTYDFTAVDRAYDHWKARGKRIQLRLSTESLLWWNTLDPPRGVGVPRYVLDKLAPDTTQQRTLEGAHYTVVDARDRFYLERLEQFLAAVAKHFDAARPVTYVDLRGFGVWGEWHSGFRYESTDARRDALKGVIDRYTAAFPDHPVALSYSHDPDGPKEYFAGPTDRYDKSDTRSYTDFVRYSAFDHALTRPNIAFRRDGCGAAVYSNQRKLCEEAFATLRTGPMMSEFCGGYASNKVAGDRWLSSVIDDALSLHPNYVNLLGWQAGDALAFTREHPDLIARGLRTMGYRLVPSKIRYSPIVKAGEAIEIQMRWSNQGVGRAMRDFYLVLMLDDRKVEGGVIPSARWVGGDSHDVGKSVDFNIPPGDYALGFYLEDRKYGQRIALPLKGGKDRAYPLGRMRITPR